MKVTFLGTGTSQGIPIVGCDCPICNSSNPKDSRLRSSVMLSIENTNIVIDVGPDFRQQMLNNKVRNVDGILITHEHNDHLIGLDDVRPFNFMSNNDMKVLACERTAQSLQEKFKYIFQKNPYPGAPRIALEVIDVKDAFKLLGIEIMPIEVMHGEMPILGFRVGDFTYITDAKTISEKSIEKIKGTKVLVLNALRNKSHHSHLSVSEAVELANIIQPEMTYLTHLSHFAGSHTELENRLPNNVRPAFDQLVIEI